MYQTNIVHHGNADYLRVWISQIVGRLSITSHVWFIKNIPTVFGTTSPYNPITILPAEIQTYNQN
jgi:hypothetical protein